MVPPPNKQPRVYQCLFILCWHYHEWFSVQRVQCIQLEKAHLYAVLFKRSVSITQNPFSSTKIPIPWFWVCGFHLCVDFQQEIPWFHLVPLCSAASDTRFPPVVDGAFLDTPISNFSLETVNVFQQADWSAAVPIWRSNFSGYAGYAGRSLSLWVSTALVPEHGFLAYRPARIKLCTAKSIQIHIRLGPWPCQSITYRITTEYII